jgi:hypothetical protein
MTQEDERLYHDIRQAIAESGRRFEERTAMYAFLGRLVDPRKQEAADRVVEAADCLLKAGEAAIRVWEQGHVDRGWRDDPNWIDEVKDELDGTTEAYRAALAAYRS